jgi:hypothetical protein
MPTSISLPGSLPRPAVLLPETAVRRKTIKLVTMVSSCNFLEMYDFMVFGLCSVDREGILSSCQ